MTWARLYTSDADYVGSVTLPNFEPPIEIVAFATRLFVHVGAGVYREAGVWRVSALLCEEAVC
jgi:hypothetical protein